MMSRCGSGFDRRANRGIVSGAFMQTTRRSLAAMNRRVAIGTPWREHRGRDSGVCDRTSSEVARSPPPVRKRDLERLWPQFAPKGRRVAGRWLWRAEGQRRRPRRAQSPILAERRPKRENAAKVSRRRSLKTKGPVAFATGPAIEGQGWCDSVRFRAPGTGRPHVGTR
jgi:hypothetical protein